MNSLNKFKSPSFILFLVLTTFLYSCNEEESQTLDVSSKIELVSPMGFKIADNISNLKEILDLSESSKIENVTFEENDKFNVAFIDYVDKDGIESNYAIGIGALKFYSDKMEIGGNPSNTSRSMNRRWRISCGGCSDPCGVGGTLDNEGNMAFNCESSCCILEVEEIL